MKLTRGKRIALELLGPTVISSSIILLIISVNLLVEQGCSSVAFHQMGQYAFVVPLGALMWSGLQSIVCALFLEWRFTRGLNPGSVQTVKLCTLLGFLSATLIVIALGAPVSETVYFWAVLGALGLLVGFILGLLIKFGSAHKKAEAENAP